MSVMATTSTAKVTMFGGLAFNAYGDVVLTFDEPIDGLVDGVESVRDTITLSRGAFGAYLRDNVSGYSAKMQSLAKDKERGTALVQRFFSVALEHAVITVTAHHHSAGDSYGDGVFAKDGYHYTIDAIDGIDERVLAACAKFSTDELDKAIF